MLPFRSGSVITAKISDTRPKIVRQKLNVSSVEKATHTKDAQTEIKSNQIVLIAKDHMLLTIKGVQLIKKQVFCQHVVDNQKSYASILKQNRPRLNNLRLTHSPLQPIS